MSLVSILIPSRNETYLNQMATAAFTEAAGCIYLLTNIVNGKQYVGQTTQGLKHRCAQHLCDAKRKRRQPITQAINKYGSANFTVEQLHLVNSKDPLRDLNLLEPHYIVLYDTLAPGGYNLEGGGKNKGALHEQTKAKLRVINTGNQYAKGAKRSEEFKRQLGERKKGNQNCKGKLLSPERKAALSALRKGKPLSLEHRANLSTSHKESYQNGYIHPLKGKSPSEETRRKISATLKARFQNQRDGGAA